MLLKKISELQTHPNLVAHDCGYPLSRYTCRATRVAADFLDFIAFKICRCSTGVARHPPKKCRTEIWVWKGVALHWGVATTIAGVELHCATKHPNLHSPVWEGRVKRGCANSVVGLELAEQNTECSTQELGPKLRFSKIWHPNSRSRGATPPLRVASLRIFSVFHSYMQNTLQPEILAKTNSDNMIACNWYENFPRK